MNHFKVVDTNVKLTPIVAPKNTVKTSNVLLPVTNAVKEPNAFEYQVTAQYVNARKITSAIHSLSVALNVMEMSTVHRVNLPVFMVSVKIHAMG